MTSISVLGCGWLGLPLAKHLIDSGFMVKGSIRSSSKISDLEKNHIKPYLLDIDAVEQSWSQFLISDVLIIAIPSKNIEGFTSLIPIIEASSIKHVLFVSSTSVYEDANRVVTEEDATIPSSALSQIERLFMQSTKFTTTVIRFS